MNDSPVTRREFYGALVVVWLYIMLVIGDLLRIEWRWSTAILWLASLFMMVVYALISLRGVSSRTPSPLPPPSQRVKDLAADPARKIEAIQLYREETGASLAEAKDAVEALVNN